MSGLRCIREIGVKSTGSSWAGTTQNPEDKREQEQARSLILPARLGIVLTLRHSRMLKQVSIQSGSESKARRYSTVLTVLMARRENYRWYEGVETVCQQSQQLGREISFRCVKTADQQCWRLLPRRLMRVIKLTVNPKVTHTVRNLGSHITCLGGFRLVVRMKWSCLDVYQGVSMIVCKSLKTKS